MTKKVVEYRHPDAILGQGTYAETIAVFDDGTEATVDTQYSVVLPHGQHAKDCDQINKMGGRCSCGKLDGIDVAALVADARINGKRGPAPKAPVARTAEDLAMDSELAKASPVCPHCGTYCYGDCQANR